MLDKKHILCYNIYIHNRFSKRMNLSGETVHFGGLFPFVLLT